MCFRRWQGVVKVEDCKCGPMEGWQFVAVQLIKPVQNFTCKKF